MNSLFHALSFPFVLFDRFIQKIVDAIVHQIMWTTGWGKSVIRLISNIVALFFGVCLALSFIHELKGFHICTYAILFIALMRAVTAQGEYRMDTEAEKKGMRSQADLRIIKAGWHGRVWFWFVAFFQGCVSVYVPTTGHSHFFYFFNGYISTWIWLSYFAHTPPAPPSRQVKVPKTVLNES
jgi:hypothetical protein